MLLGIELVSNVYGDGICGSTGGTAVGEGDCMEGGLPAGVGPVGSAVAVSVGVIEGTKLG